MTWSASRRYGLHEAPVGLVLIQDFLNTRPRRDPESVDLLATVRAAQDWSNDALRQWCQDTGRVYQRVKLTKADVEILRGLRSEWAAALHSRDGGRDVEPGGDVHIAEIGISAMMSADGSVGLEPVGQGWRRVASAMMLEANRAQVAGTWRRLKLCRNGRCPGAFYDRSPNNSGVWHDVRTCGNIANLRAARARRRARQ